MAHCLRVQSTMWRQLVTWYAVGEQSFLTTACSWWDKTKLLCTQANREESTHILCCTKERLDTVYGCRTDAGPEANGRDFGKRSPLRGLRRTLCTLLGWLIPAQRVPTPVPPTVTLPADSFRFLSSTFHPVTFFVAWAQHLLPGSLKIQAYIFKICFLVVTVNIEEEGKKASPFIPLGPLVHFRKYIFR